MKFNVLFLVLLFLSGCTSVNKLDVSRSEISTMRKNLEVTFSDYGNSVSFDDKSGLHKYVVYIGGFGGCKGSLLQYAQPKMDNYMLKNEYANYIVTETHHIMSPPTRCEIYIKYEK